MVFVVSFASCLDVAAISIDMGKALDTNRELATVGICNLMSGLTFGFTGSYIFSQTIFTYRTGVHSRWIGAMIMCVFLYIVVSPVNVLQIAPLFFFGSTLIFIGYDLLYEWLWEIRHQVFLTEYLIVLLTFVFIQIVGIDFGIVLGVLVAIIEHVVLTVQTSGVHRIQKRSRAVWTPGENKILHNYAYNYVWPKIVTLEINGTVFFGSSLLVLNQISQEIGLNTEGVEVESSTAGLVRSPHTPHAASFMLNLERRASAVATPAGQSSRPGGTPKFVVLDLGRVTHMDVSATRGCFLQLVKMCANRGIIICASGFTPRVEWLFRTHEVSFRATEEEDTVKAQLQSRGESALSQVSLEHILLFVNLQEALEFCETSLLHKFDTREQTPSLARIQGPQEQSFSGIIAHVLGSSLVERDILKRIDGQRYYEEVELNSGELVFQKDTHSDAFYVVLKGKVANTVSARAVYKQRQEIISGAGPVQQPEVRRSYSDLRELSESDHGVDDEERRIVATMWTVGGVFGYVDFFAERPRFFRAIAARDGTRVAKLTHSHLNLMMSEDPDLYALLQRALLHASVTDLVNCTCLDV
jgi:CRP-like cAMP-binding protein/anti-anti-sigma regulatory factor